MQAALYGDSYAVHQNTSVEFSTGGPKFKY